MRLHRTSGVVLRAALNHVAWLALVLGLPQGSVVLCIGPDGHVAVESAVGGDPDVRRVDDGGAPATASERCCCSDACDPCHDVRLGASGAGVRLREPHKPVTQSEVIGGIPGRSTDLTDTRTAGRPPAPPVDLLPPSTSLRESVVLLI